MIVTYTIIAFIVLLFPTIYQIIGGFNFKSRNAINKRGIRSATFQLASIIIAYIIFLKIDGANPNLALYTGITFFITLALIVLIQHLIFTLKNK